MDIIRFLGLYFVFVIIILNFSYFIYKLMKEKNKDLLTYNISLFYIFGILGISLNFIYASIFDTFIVSILHRIAILCFPFSFFFSF